MDASLANVVLFAKNHDRVAAFYAGALGLRLQSGDAEHNILEGQGYEIVVQKIPQHLAAAIRTDAPPVRRTAGAIRLDFIVTDIDDCRAQAKSLGGYVDATPPVWAGGAETFYLGCDPEGNVIGVHCTPA